MTDLGAPEILKALIPSEIRFLAAGNSEDIQNVAKILVASGFSGETCADTTQGLALLGQSPFQVVLCNSNLPPEGGLAFLEAVRQKFPDVASVFLSDPQDPLEAVRSAHVGVSDCILKPLRPEPLVVRVHRAVALRRISRGREKQVRTLKDLIRRRTIQVERARLRVERTCEEILQVMGYMLETRDNETAGHCQRVTRYTLELAKALHCSLDEIKTIVRGAYLHDLGKIGIPDAILRKPGPLTAEERAVAETHVRLGYDMVRRISFLAGPAEIVLTHQERFDGTGYPQGLVGHEIPLGSRIFAIADTLDAITRDRPYRDAQPYSVARDEIVRESGHQFDPDVVAAFLSLPSELWERIRDDVRQHAIIYDPYWWIDLHSVF